MKKENLLQLHGRSVFSTYLTEFVAQKRALGCKYNTAVETLNLFDDFCVSQGISEAALTNELFQKWSEKRPAENETTHQIRVVYIQEFAKFLLNQGIAAPISFHPLPKRSHTFIPYIFTEEEIKRFFAALDFKNLVPSSISPIKHLVHPVLFRTLYGCGLRVNEALKLKVEDVDLQNGVMLIRMAKGGKDRMVVLSDSLADVFRAYRSDPMVRQFESEFFFPAKDHGFYDSSTIYAEFRRILFLSGISHKGRGKGPRLHDFRHTFSVRVLNSWAQQGKDLYVCLPVLQMYLGHSRLSVTEKYLQFIPEAFSPVTSVLEDKFGNIFPEVPNESL